MKKNKLISIFAALFFLAVQAACLFADAGITSGQILFYNPNPATGAMGDAGVALTSEKPIASILNPAATLSNYRIVASVSNSSLFADIQYNYIGAQFPTLIGKFGLSFIYTGYGDIDYRDINNNKIKMNDSSDIAFILNYSLDIKRTIPLEVIYGGFGINIKALRSNLGDYNAEAFAMDFGGILTIPSIDSFSFAMAYRNLGTDLKFVKESNPLPQTFAVGLAYQEKNFNDLKVALDFNVQSYSSNYFSVGASITPVYFLTLRGGVKLAEESLNTDFRMGFGLEFQSFMLDYSYTPSDKLNGTHNFNLSFAIGDFSNQKAAYDYYMQNHFREAAELYHRKDYIAARQKFDEILSVYPEHRPSQRYLQRIIDELSDIDIYNARRVNKYMRRANKAIDRGDAVAASNYFNKILELDPENSLAKTGVEKVDEYTNIVSIERERQKNKDRIEYLWNRSDRFYKKGELVRAKESLGYILDIDPENQPAKDGIVNIDNQLSKIAADKVAEMYSRGMDLFNQGKFQEAIRYFEAIVIAAPHRRDAQDLIARAEKNIQEITEYERASKVAAAQDKVRGELARNFETALKYYEKNRLAEAVKYFKRSKEIADKYEFEEYSKNTQTYISKISYDLSEQHYRRGFELFRKNDFEGAAKEYKLSLSYNPNNTSAAFEYDRISGELAQKYYEEGMSYYSRSDFEKAREYLKKSLYYRPNKTEAKRALEKIQ